MGESTAITGTCPGSPTDGTRRTAYMFCNLMGLEKNVLHRLSVKTEAYKELLSVVQKPRKY